MPARLWLVCMSLVLVSSVAVTAEDWGRPTLGTRFLPLDAIEDVIGPKGKLPAKHGLVVMDVVPNSPASKAGLKPLDLITKINRKPVASAEDVREVVTSVGAGKPVNVEGYTLINNVWKPGKVKFDLITMREMLSGAVQCTKDSISDVLYCNHVQEPEFRHESDFHLYVVKGKQEATLRCRFSRVSADWVFVHTLAIRPKNGEAFQFKLNEFKREDKIIGGGNVSEWFDIPLTDDLKAAIESLVDMNGGIIRLDGKSTYTERKLKLGELARLSDVLRFHEMISEVAQQP